MTRMNSILAILTLALIASCSDSPESLAEDNLEAMNDLTEILQGIKTKDDAEDAKGDLEELVDRIQDLKTRGEEMAKDMDDEEKAAITKEFAEQMKKVSSDLGKEMARIAMDPDLRGAMDSMVQKLSKLK